MKSVDRGLFLVLILVASAALINFSKSFNNWDVEGDGFIYLTMSKHHVLVGETKLRSPLVVLFLFPDVHLARLEMIAFHLGITALIYALCRRNGISWVASMVPATIYGINWWFVQFTTYVLMELPAIFSFLLSLYLLPSNPFAAGLLQGLVFVLKPHYLIFILALIPFTRNRKRLLMGFVLLVGFVELLADAVFYSQENRIVYSPWEFIKYNLFQGRDPIQREYSSKISVEFLVGRVISRENPLREPIFRWTLAPLLPLLILLMGMKFGEKLKTKSMLLGVLIYLVGNLLMLASLEYENFRPDLVKIPRTWDIASNYASMVSFFTSEGCDDFDVEQTTADAINKVKEHKYLVLVKHPNFMRFYEEVKRYADENMVLIDRIEEGIEIRIYARYDNRTYEEVRSESRT